MQLHSPLAWLRWIGRNAKRLLITVIGFTVLGAGIAMLALPGPGIVVILLGLAILATEFAWAERALDQAASRAAGAAKQVSDSRAGRYAMMLSGLGLLVGGAIVLVFVERFRWSGIGLLIAGLCGIATLLPRVQTWLDATTSKSGSR